MRCTAGGGATEGITVALHTKGHTQMMFGCYGGRGGRSKPLPKWGVNLLRACHAKAVVLGNYAIQHTGSSLG
jgi:hypothetical protein